MIKFHQVLLLSFLLTSAFSCQNQENHISTNEIIRYDRPESGILKGVYIPVGKELYFTSGLVAPVKDENAEIGTYQRYGNTYEQSVATLKKIEATLQEAKFELKDVYFLRVYLAPNRNTGEVDFDAWFKAYGEFFNNDNLKEKVARSTIAVYSLAHPDLLIEIEACAAK
ncbi:hypothetical protein JKA74_02385 [Marivirga sp. S37H4]|uniref:Uncharacterized protein n=1 Tax=Marivirga aurantiaca TaxID=2802615 RepID=A0A934WVU3_9BACT|nr:Rid family hydrolase [Marivirga aurantiaca]MBK6263871.1 hypothetical protein [Marivirga aurantiaca]